MGTPTLWFGVTVCMSQMTTSAPADFLEFPGGRIAYVPDKPGLYAWFGGAGEIDVEDLAVHDKGDFLGGQRLLAF